MTTSSRLEVAFNEPSNGWLGVEIRAGGQHIRESFSHIYPTLTDLCSALCDALSGIPSRRVVFLLEPAELELTIEPESPTSSCLSVRAFPSRLRTARPPAIFEHFGMTSAIVVTFWRALRRLQTCIPGAQFSERFRQPFPELEMASLTRLISTQKDRRDTDNEAG